VILVLVCVLTAVLFVWLLLEFAGRAFGELAMSPRREQGRGFGGPAASSTSVRPVAGPAGPLRASSSPGAATSDRSAAGPESEPTMVMPAVVRTPRAFAPAPSPPAPVPAPILAPAVVAQAPAVALEPPDPPAMAPAAVHAAVAPAVRAAPPPPAVEVPAPAVEVPAPAVEVPAPAVRAAPPPAVALDPVPALPPARPALPPAWAVAAALVADEALAADAARAREAGSTEADTAPTRTVDASLGESRVPAPAPARTAAPVAAGGTVGESGRRKDLGDATSGPGADGAKDRREAKRLTRGRKREPAPLDLGANGARVDSTIDVGEVRVLSRTRRHEALVVEPPDDVALESGVDGREVTVITGARWRDPRVVEPGPPRPGLPEGSGASAAELTLGSGSADANDSWVPSGARRAAAMVGSRAREAILGYPFPATVAPSLPAAGAPGSGQEPAPGQTVVLVGDDVEAWVRERLYGGRLPER